MEERAAVEKREQEEAAAVGCRPMLARAGTGWHWRRRSMRARWRAREWRPGAWLDCAPRRSSAGM